MNEIKELQRESKSLIAKGELQNSINLLTEFTESKKPSFYNELILLNNRLSAIKKSRRLNLLSSEALNLEESKITYSILEIIDELELEQISIKTKNNAWFYLGLIFRATKNIISFYLVFTSFIVFYFRRDILYRILALKENAPLEELFFPFFLFGIGLYLFLLKIK